jgi:signal transduction histidine kinase/putative methionine-R-sulfoxide reductase with GAF domain
MARTLVDRSHATPGYPLSVTLKSEPPRSMVSRVADLETALAREMRISKALCEVGLALGTTLDLDPLLELILRNVTDALEADRATLYLLDEARDELVSRVLVGGDAHSIRMKAGAGIAGAVVRTGKSILAKDAYKDPRFSPEFDNVTGYRTRSILAGPMKNHLGRTIGVIQVLNKKHGEFSDHDAAILAALATQAGVSIDNSRLFLSVTQKNMQLLDTKEQLEDRVRDLKLLFELEHAMGRATSLDDLFLAVLGEAMRTCDARAAAVALRDREAGTITLHLIDEKHPKTRRLPLKDGQGLIGHAMSSNELVMISNAAGDARNDPELDKLVGFHCTSALAVPFAGEDGEAIGAIALYNKIGGRGFSEADKALLVLIGANASTAVQLQLSREMREREERLTTIGRLLSSVIHDLKTPLTVISGYVQLMQICDTLPKRSEYAEQILKQFDHIASMQREVLEFARGEKSVLIRRVYLQKFFDDVRAQLEHDLARHSVELVVDVVDKGTARFDEGKILRIVHNLARNAVDAMGEKGGKFSIRVTRNKEKDEVVVAFSDTGPGIPKEIEHRLFQSFVTTGKKGGTGLGLAIVKKIAEEHGGKITVHSTNKGATFTLRIPQDHDG